MISRSDDYVEYCRETARHARDLHDLALRGSSKKETTRITHEQIVATVKLGPQDQLLDIGCGDGTLLRMAQQCGVKSATGLLATEEEVALVRKTGVDVRQGLSDNLPLADASVSVVVCNNVLLIVPRERIPGTLREILRVAKPGARVFIGEIPFVQTKDPTPTFDTTGEMLSYLYHRHGLRTWFGMVRRLTKARITGTPFVMRPGTAVSFYAGAQEFIAMAEKAGLEIVSFWQHHDPPNRNNYLFRRPV